MDAAARRFVELINTPAAERHLDLLCALMSASLDGNAEVGAMLLGLDRLADQCPPTFDGIIDTLFSSGLFSGESDDYYHPRNSLLHEVLARHSGMPITLGVVAMEVGKRLEVPIAGIGMPGHFVIRDGANGDFADPYGGGIRHDEAGMIESWQQRMGPEATFRRSMLAPASTHDIVLRILNNLKHSLLARTMPIMLARLVPLRAAFEEFAGEADEHRHWMRHFN